MFKKIIFRFLNFSPLMHISCDENFGEFDAEGVRRVSLFALTFFLWKVYFLSFKNCVFSPVKVIDFREVCPVIDQKEVDEKTRGYIYYAMQKDEEITRSHYEYLKENYNSITAAKASLETRVSAYISSYLVLLGFFAYLFSELIKKSNNNLFFVGSFIFISGILFLLSTATFMWHFLVVKSVVRSTFRELKATQGCIQKALASAMYTNWYAATREFQRLASLVKNIEINFFISLVIGVALWVVTFIDIGQGVNEKNLDEIFKGEYLISDPEGVFHQKYLSDLLNDLNRDKSIEYRQYIIFGGQANKDQLNIIKLGTKSYIMEKNVSLVEIALAPNFEKSILVKIERIEQ